MPLRECSNCSETVDEAKAFCPGCGNALVEEERPTTTAFQKLDHTVQFGQTMYNQMLEDMGLNISDTPTPNENRIEVINPIESDISVPPARTSNAPPALLPLEIVNEANTSRNFIAYILGALAVIILLPIAVVSAILFLRYLAALVPLK